SNHERAILGDQIMERLFLFEWDNGHHAALAAIHWRTALKTQPTRLPVMATGEGNLPSFTSLQIVEGANPVRAQTVGSRIRASSASPSVGWIRWAWLRLIVLVLVAIVPYSTGS